MTVLPQGWLSPPEAELLCELAEDKVVLELGSYQGRSTVAMAQSARLVVSVDHHYTFADTDGSVYQDSLAPYFANTRSLANVISVVGRFEKVVPLFHAFAFQLIFLDGLHAYEDVIADLELCERFGAAVFAVHDYTRAVVKQACDDRGLTVVTASTDDLAVVAYGPET